MTALCGGGTSGLKSASPAQVFLTSQGIQALVEEILGASDPFIDIAIFAAGQTIDLTTFCSTDPPAMPTFSVSDIADIIAMFPGASTPGAAKILDLIQNVAWYQYCQCTTGSPTPVTTPSYPSGAPVVSTPGAQGTPNQVNQPCFSGTDTTTYGFTGVGVGYNTEGPDTDPPDPSVTSATITALNHTFTSPGYVLTLTGHCQDNTNTDLQTPVNLSLSPGQTGTLTMSVPIGTHQVIYHFVASSGSGASQLWSPTLGSVGVDWSYYCNGQLPGGNSSPCCPPDPNTNALLQQILNELNAIYSLIPVAVPNYAAGVAHTGLSGGGNQTLTGPDTIAILVTVTTLPSNYGEIAGTPNTYLDIGWITPENNEGISEGTPVTRLTQTFVLPPATSSINYSLPAGEVITITELQAG